MPIENDRFVSRFAERHRKAKAGGDANGSTDGRAPTGVAQPSSRQNAEDAMIAEAAGRLSKAPSTKCPASDGGAEGYREPSAKELAKIAEREQAQAKRRRIAEAK